MSRYLPFHSVHSGGKLPTCILPGFPPLAILVAEALLDSRSDVGLSRSALAGAIAFLVAPVGFVIWLPYSPEVGLRAKRDPEGDPATFLAFNLPSEDQAQKFQNLLSAEGVDTVCYKRNLWHYVPNWEHFLAKSTANSKKYPFTNPTYKGKVEYKRENIPQAEDILGRTLVIGISVKMSQEKLDGIRKGIEQAAKNM